MAGLVSQATIEQIRAASDIVDVIGGYLPLKKAGGNFMTLCPFHKEKTPSFNVSPQRQIFHCFGCHKGGDVFTFVREYENLTFMEAIKRLAERANIPLEFEQQSGESQSRFLKESLWQIHEQITQRWQTALSNEASGQMARDYLAQRGVTAEAIQLFRLGYAPELWDDTVNWARSKKFELSLAEQAGLILRKEGSEHYYDRFRGRLIFPICDEQGKIIAFSGRILEGDEKAAKYVNSPETPIFTKSKVFYGLDKSRRAIIDAGYSVICEGQLDLIACYMAGTKNVVAPQGTAFTADHARILKRHADEVVLCFDSDPAGQAAAVRVLDSLLTSGLAIRVATVPAPDDPDSFIKQQGGAAFQQLIERAEGFFDFYLKHLCAMHNVETDKGRMAVVRAMGEALRKTSNAVLMDTHAQRAAQRLGVAPEAIRAEFRKGSHAPSISRDTVLDEDETVSSPPPPEREFWLMRFLLQSDDIDWLAQHLDLEWFQHPMVRQVVALRFEAQAEQRWHGVAGLLAECPDAPTQSLITEAVAKEVATENLDQNIAEAVTLLRSDFIDRALTRLTRQLSQPTLTDTELIEIEKQKIELRQLKRQSITLGAAKS